MAELSALLHEISVAFGCSTNSRTLLVRLADGMGRHLPVAEVESMRLLEHRGEVRISAYAPGIARRWDGQRSRRFLEQQQVVAPRYVTDELARVAITPIAGKLKLPVGRTGLLSIAFETDISVILGDDTDIMVDVLALHCSRLGQLTATAARCRMNHRKIGISPTTAKTSITENPVKQPSTQTTEIAVETIDAALVRCICSALAQTSGKIYGECGAAALLGLKPSTLQSKMRKLGIERTAFTR